MPVLIGLGIGAIIGGAEYASNRSNYLTNFNNQKVAQKYAFATHQNPGTPPTANGNPVGDVMGGMASGAAMGQGYQNEQNSNALNAGLQNWLKSSSNLNNAAATSPAGYGMGNYGQGSSSDFFNMGNSSLSSPQGGQAYMDALSSPSGNTPPSSQQQAQQYVDATRMAGEVGSPVSNQGTNPWSLGVGTLPGANNPFQNPYNGFYGGMTGMPGVNGGQPPLWYSNNQWGNSGP